MKTSKELFSLSNIVLVTKLNDETCQLRANGESTQLLVDAFPSGEDIGKLYGFMSEREITFWDEVLPIKYIKSLESVGIYHGLSLKKCVSDNNNLFLSLGFSSKVTEPVSYYLNTIAQSIEYLESQCENYIDIFGLNENLSESGYKIDSSVKH